MKKVTYGPKGELLDAESGVVIGKRESDGTFTPTPPASSKGSVESSPTTSQSPSVPTVSIPLVSFSRYEVTPESEFTIRFCLGFNEGRVQIYTEDAYLKQEDLERHWVKFRMWKYEEELTWQNQSMEFQHQTRTFVHNQNKLNELKIRHLIKAWSFEEYDPKFKLLHVNGVLSDESYNTFKGFFPTIINNIIYMMNQVLEQNG